MAALVVHPYGLTVLCALIESHSTLCSLLGQLAEHCLRCLNVRGAPFWRYPLTKVAKGAMSCHCVNPGFKSGPTVGDFEALGLPIAGNALFDLVEDVSRQEAPGECVRLISRNRFQIIARPDETVEFCRDNP